MTSAAAPRKPRLRGVSHQYAFFVSLGCGIALVLAARGRAATVGAAVYAGAVSALLGTSALYHRVTWRPRVRRWMRRLDHAMIFVLIAGTYTPVALLALHGPIATAILWVVWGAALAGIVLKLVWIDAPRWLIVALYVALGWVSVAVLGRLPATIGWLGVAGLATGGVLYTAGGVVYAARRPDPVPATFGYHEVFHALVLAALALHYAVVAFAVLPRG